MPAANAAMNKNPSVPKDPAPGSDATASGLQVRCAGRLRVHCCEPRHERLQMLLFLLSCCSLLCLCLGNRPTLTASPLSIQVMLKDDTEAAVPAGEEVGGFTAKNSDKPTLQAIATTTTVPPRWLAGCLSGMPQLPLFSNSLPPYLYPSLAGLLPRMQDRPAHGCCCCFTRQHQDDDDAGAARPVVVPEAGLPRGRQRGHR